MINGLNSIRKERAMLERDRVVIGSMIEDAEICEAFEELTDEFFEGVSSEEIEELIDRIPESDEKDEQVERILRSSEDLDVDEIISDDIDDDDIV